MIGNSFERWRRDEFEESTEVPTVYSESTTAVNPSPIEFRPDHFRRDPGV
jgi:hypothetical protein